MSSSAVKALGPARNRLNPKEVHSSKEVDVPSQLDTTKPQKTYGRTPDGTIFIVPTTHDMVSQLLDPRQPKNASDIFVLSILALHILAYIYLPSNIQRPILAASFIFWRASYNIGIGILLTIQSHYQRLVTWARRWQLFETLESGKQPRPWLYLLLKHELEIKIPEDYNIDEAPIEYNTWLVFRRVVDLILMCDFVSYCLFAIASARAPEGETTLLALVRWGLGIGLVGFNLWVKLDAHRVVKDYAWYWGDFFYLIDQELTFDGVFEMAPHPMYSVGYAGYYGISMMAASYDVLFISIAAHLAQMGFLVIVENPHIEKTYNPPAPRVRSASGSENGTKPVVPVDVQKPTVSVYKLIGFLDLHRSTDYTILLLHLYIFILTIATLTTPLTKVLFAAHAAFWRVWYVGGLGFILRAQSTGKSWTRHFVKYGEGKDEAWRQWKYLSHISMHICYASFVAACWKLYTVPEDWTYGFALLRHILGAGLMALQAWTAFSIYAELGEFGWFFGDFFFDAEAKLSYRHIYRFLNNPERVLGTAGVWGAALITWSRTIFGMALITQLLVLFVIAAVEKPHMQKIYGEKLRREAGLTKFIRKSLPITAPVQRVTETVDKAMDDSINFVAEFLASARPRLAAGVTEIVKEASELFHMYPARLTVTRVPDDLAGHDSMQYGIEIVGTKSQTGEDGEGPMVLEYGEPIRLRWRAPKNHGSADWIGLYRVSANRSTVTTDISSRGRWSPITPGFYDKVFSEASIITHDAEYQENSELVQGETQFLGDQLFWITGLYEFRYHHHNTHSVLTLTPPFELQITPPTIVSDPSVSPHIAIANSLLPMVIRCFDSNPDIAPSTIFEPFGDAVEREAKYGKRVVYGVRGMFGVEFAEGTVAVDGCVERVGWRIWKAKEVLKEWVGEGNGKK